MKYLALFALAIAAANEARAQCAATDSQVVVRAEGAAVNLSATKSERLPYGYPLHLFARAGGTDSVRRAEVAYHYTGHRDGPRAGVAAATEATSRCWVATLPKLRINEEGRFSARFFLEPTTRGTIPDPARTVTFRFVAALAAVPADLSIVSEAPRIARTVLDSFFLNSDSLVVPDERDETEFAPLADRLAAAASDNLKLSNLFSTLRNSARNVRDRLSRSTAAPLLDRVRLRQFCPGSRTLRELLTTAETVAESDNVAVIALFENGTLPLSPCALDLLDPDAGADSSLRILTSPIERLVRVDGLGELRALIEQATTVIELSVVGRALTVSIGASLLERYTQVDLVSAVIPQVDMVQAFSAVTWYAWNTDRGSIGSIKPSFRGRDMLGFQFGYPVGQPVKGESSEFEPRYLIGLILRLNPQLSLSAGGIVGKRTVGGVTRSRMLTFTSINLDLTSLTPFRDIFARRDN